MRRLAHFSLYNPRGDLDPAAEFFLKSLAEHCDVYLSANGGLNEQAKSLCRNIVKDIRIRKNEGLDVESHREFIQEFGAAKIAEYDEFIILNHTCFGPIFPFSELFDEMETRDADLWGVMAHKEVIPNPFTGNGKMPSHINANFVVFRKKITSSSHFSKYWASIPRITSYNDAVYLHESILTKYFSDIGYKVSTYVDGDLYGTRYPGMFDVDETIINRNPLLKRRAFFHEPRYLESEGMDLPRALRVVRDRSNYDMNLIWSSLARSGELRFINTNAALTHVLPPYPAPKSQPKKIGKIALCAHVYYVDMMAEILSYAENMPVEFDLIITTDSDEKKKEIETVTADIVNCDNVNIIVMEKNRGRDMAALFISCREFFLSDDYELVCRIHTKKSPQISSTQGNLFKRHLLDNLLYSKGYVTNIIDLFIKNQWLGVAVPPLINLSFNHFGHAWYNNRNSVEKLAVEFGIKTPLDSETPVAIFGTMFWFRPRAIRPLFERNWDWDEFNPEPYHIDGSLAHALERFVCYLAQNQGYLTYQILTSEYAGQNYGLLEYKLQKLLGQLPLMEFNRQVDMMASWKRVGYPMAYGSAVSAYDVTVPHLTLCEVTRSFAYAARRSFVFRFPKLAYALRPAYRTAKRLFEKLER